MSTAIQMPNDHKSQWKGKDDILETCVDDYELARRAMSRKRTRRGSDSDEDQQDPLIERLIAREASIVPNMRKHGMDYVDNPRLHKRVHDLRKTQVDGPATFMSRLPPASSVMMRSGPAPPCQFN